MNYIITTTNGELYHHGILGQKWGVRRYQNKDGSLTSAGEKRYRKVSYDEAVNEYWDNRDKTQWKEWFETNPDTKKYYTKKRIKELTSGKDDNIRNLKNRMNEELKPYVENLKKVKYASKEWFEEREKYFDKVDSFGKEWTDAILNDLEIDFKNPKDKEKFSKWVGVGEGFINSNSDYRDIVDPVTGQRDYDLESRYNR